MVHDLMHAQSSYIVMNDLYPVESPRKLANDEIMNLY